MKQTIRIKRAYDPVEADDGYRVYVDRLWPRGLSHETFRYDMWDKEIAPSTALREWFHADPAGEWTEFERRYRCELLGGQALGSLADAIKGRPVVTLLYSSRDTIHNNAAVLREVLTSSRPAGA